MTMTGGLVGMVVVVHLVSESGRAALLYVFIHSTPEGEGGEQNTWIAKGLLQEYITDRDRGK